MVWTETTAIWFNLFILDSRKLSIYPVLILTQSAVEGWDIEVVFLRSMSESRYCTYRRLLYV